MNKKILSLCFLILTSSTLSFSQNKNEIIVGFYNLENLFDTIDTPGRNDFEFTPDGRRNWETEKYNNKLQKLANVIEQLNPGTVGFGPAILGVCEVENLKVLEDLAGMPAVAKSNYEIVHYESPDRRGIDVALLYNKEIFNVSNSRAVALKLENDEDFNTRDQLIVTGTIEEEKFHFIINHWPSRWGGEEESRHLRIAAAQLCRSIIDSIMLNEPESQIVIMGDMNDDPDDISLTKYLKAVNNKDNLKNSELYNTTYNLFAKGSGTLKYRGQWNLFDQIIITGSILKKDGYYYDTTNIFLQDYLLQQEGDYEGYPLRTFGGSTYLDGYSDHLPVYMVLLKHSK